MIISARTLAPRDLQRLSRSADEYRSPHPRMAQPSLLRTLATRLDSVQLARTAAAFGVAETASAVSKYASAAVQEGFEAILFRRAAVEAAP
jgi:phage gp16-like protein